MDNYRKFKPRANRPSAVDGFINSSRPGQAQTPMPGRQLSQQTASTHIGNFKAVDGFHPAAQGTMITAGRPVQGRQPKRNELGKIELQLPDAAPRAKHKTAKKRDKKKIALKSGGIVLLTLLLTIGFLFGKGYLKARNIFKGGGSAAALEENVDPSKLRGEGDGRVNILLLGKGGPGHEAPDLTDTILIASIDPIQKEASLLSVPRDLWVKTSSGGHSKINAIYANAKYAVLDGQKVDNQDEKAEEAGLDAIDKAVEDYMGIPIHYHVIVDFKGFERAIDEVGGVDINVTQDTAVAENMRIDGRNYYLNVQPGQQHFDGFRALAYSRSRHTSARGDFDRAQRQRLVLIALKDKVLSAGTFANPKKISGLIDAFGDNMKANMTVSEIMRVYEIGKDIDASKIASLSLVDPPNVLVQTGMIDGQSVVIPRAGVDDFSDIRSFVRNSLKDGFIRNENATIMVLNGTNIPGLAGRRANDLKSYGYNISAIADAPTKGYTHTILVDLRNGSKKYTKRYLEQRLGTTAVTSLPDNSINPGNADFVIILGNNEGNTY
jgi:LCP family protein required for cell wall assembly